ncbi:response regulator transcription factor [Actinomyces slackii]|uniref:Nitrogen regulation protein C n=1 Tax=Actinomyces slackii TaxID=52774 RepID=A0A448KA50_9ACTO|nr:response regulator transcription factor [Actinomyces slackii]VEG73806.1 Nitrogen regulation protein C [Actinomyces slackii]
MIRLGLTDDEPLFAAGLAMLLGAQPDMETVWQSVDGHDALRRLSADPVDILLLDIQMPGLDGLSTTREIVARGDDCRVVILTTFDTDGYVLGAIEAGAAGFLLKNTPPQELIEAVRTVHAGDSVISPGPTRRLLTAVRSGGLGRPDAPGGPDEPSGPAVSATVPPAASAGGAVEPTPEQAAARRALEPLTEREREILVLIALGLTNQEICDREWLSMATVKTHVSHLLSKTGSRDRVQLVLLALRAGAVDLTEVLTGS